MSKSMHFLNSLLNSVGEFEFFDDFTLIRTTYEGRPMFLVFSTITISKEAPDVRNKLSAITEDMYKLLKDGREIEVEKHLIHTICNNPRFEDHTKPVSTFDDWSHRRHYRSQTLKR